MPLPSNPAFHLHLTTPRPQGLSTLLAAAMAAVLLLGCGNGDADRVPLGGEGAAPSPEEVEALPAEIQAQLDSGNAAFRAHDHEEALRHFGIVTEEVPGLAAGWYGLGMTHGAAGNREAADSAMMRVHQLAPEVPLEHPGSSAPPNPHPAPRPEADDGGEASYPY